MILVLFLVDACFPTPSHSFSYCIWVSVIDRQRKSRVTHKCFWCLNTCVCRCMYVSMVTVRSWPGTLDRAQCLCDTLLVENKVFHSPCPLRMCLHFSRNPTDSKLCVWILCMSFCVCIDSHRIWENPLAERKHPSSVNAIRTSHFS